MSSSSDRQGPSPSPGAREDRLGGRRKWQAKDPGDAMADTTRIPRDTVTPSLQAGTLG